MTPDPPPAPPAPRRGRPGRAVRIVISVVAVAFVVVVIVSWVASPGRSGTGGYDPARDRAVLERTLADALNGPSPAIDEAIARFSEFYREYSVESVRAGVPAVYAEDAWFADPIGVVEGIDAIEDYFVRMAEPVQSCRFEIHQADVVGPEVYVRWTMRLALRRAPEAEIAAPGFSHVRFDDDGRVVFQRDYWDISLLMERLPVVGPPTRWIRNRLEPGH